MINAFFRRWYMTRMLYKYMYKRGKLPAIFNSLEAWPNFDATNTLPQRILSGVGETNFIMYRRWKWEGWWRGLDNEIKPDTWWKKFYFNLAWKIKKRPYIEEQWKATIKECEKLDWIERLENKNIRVGRTGMEIYVWYYPILVFFNLHYIKITLTRLIEWGVPLLLVYLLAHYLHVTLNISSNQ